MTPRDVQNVQMRLIVNLSLWLSVLLLSLFMHWCSWWLLMYTTGKSDGYWNSRDRNRGHISSFRVILVWPWQEKPPIK